MKKQLENTWKGPKKRRPHWQSLKDLLYFSKNDYSPEACFKFFILFKFPSPKKMKITHIRLIWDQKITNVDVETHILFPITVSLLIKWLKNNYFPLEILLSPDNLYERVIKSRGRVAHVLGTIYITCGNNLVALIVTSFASHG